MANNSSTFTLGIKTKVDSAELNRLKQQLKEIQLMASDVDFTTGMNPTQIQHMTTAARQLDAALTAAFDVELNTLNIQKFSDYLKRTGTDLQQIQKGLYNAGAVGQASFAKATAELFKFNTTAKQTNVFLDKIADTMANTVRWGVTSSIFNNIVGSVQKAYYYIEDLDTSINDIQIVTEKSADEMARFAEQANNAAKALATTTTDYTEGALIYYQQGLDDETVKTLTDITAKTSNVTGQSMQSVSEQLTAVWNGYQVANEAAAEGMQVYEEYVDKMAAVGAATASDLEELATAMSKVASAANAMGVDFDQLSAQIATIVSVTRQAPESVGTALKTIYARIGDLKMDGVDEFGVTLGEVSSQLDHVGIQIMDQSGNLRDVGIVMEEVAAKWGTWNEAQQQSIAIAIAGKRQYNNLLALFENWDMYTDTLETAANAAGTLDKQQSIALESLENKLEKLSATAEDLYDSLFDEESLKNLVDGVTPLVQGLADIADAIGGLNNLLPMLGSIGMQVFSKHLANGLATFRHNLLLTTSETYKQNQAIQELSEKYKTLNFADSSGKVDAAQKAVLQDMVNFTEEMLTKRKYMTEEEEEYYNKILDEKAVLAEQVALLKVAKEHRDNETGFGLSKAFEGNLDVKKVEQYNSALVFLEKQLNDLRSGKKGVIGLENVEKAKTDLYSFVQVLKSMGASQDSIDIVEKKIRNLGRTIDGTKKISDQSLNKIITYFKDFSFAAMDVAKLEGEVEELGLSIQKTENNFKNNLKFKDFVNTASNAIGALGQLATSLSTLKNIGEIWNNEDLEVSEKMLQTLINMSYALPALVTSIITLNKELGIVSFLMPILSDITFAYTAVTGGAATVTEGFVFALESLKTAALGNPFTAFITGLIALVGVIGLAVTAYDVFTTSLEEQEEACKKAGSKYKELEDSLKSLESELKSTEDRLKELYEIAQQDLTTTDEKEIALLEAKTAQLEAQVAAEKELAKYASEEFAQSASESGNKGAYNIENETETFTNSYSVDPITGIQNRFVLDKSLEVDYNMTPEEWEQFLANNGAVNGKITTSGKMYSGNLPIIGVNSTQQIDVNQGRKNYLEQLQRNFDYYITEGRLQAWKDNNQNGIYNEDIKKAEEELFKYYKNFGATDTFSKNAVDTFRSESHLKNVLGYALNEENQSIDENSFINAFGRGGKKAFEELKAQADGLGISMYDLLKSAEEYGYQMEKTGKQGKKSFKEFAQGANKLHIGLDALREVYLDVENGGGLDFSKILDDEDFVKSFQNLEAYEEFLDTIVQSPDNIEACQEAFNNLAGEYLETTGILENLSDETKETAINLLEQEGIVNASEVVDYYLGLANATDELTEAKNKLGYTTVELEKLTEEELEEILNEGEVSEYAQAKLYELYLTQALLNDTPTETEESINNLIGLVGASSAAGIALTELIDIMAQISDIEIKLDNKFLSTKKRLEYENQKEELERQAEEIKETAFEAFDDPVEYKSIDYKGKDVKAKAKDLKEYLDEFDRYWDINKAIEKVVDSLEDLSKIQDHLFGKELISSLERENQLLEEQADKYRTLYSLQQQEAAELRASLGQYGVSFGEDGGIANYAAITQAMIGAYNSGSISEDSYDKFKKAIERYETLFYQEMIDVQNQLDDIYYEQLANNLEAWETEIELNLDLSEAEREWSDFIKEINDDFKMTYRDIGKDFENIVDKMSSYANKTIEVNTQAIRDVMAEIDKLQKGQSSEMFASMSEAQEKLKELQKNLMDDAEAAHGLWVEVWEAYLEGIDQAADKLDDLMNKFELIDEELEYQRELIELLYGNEAYDLMNSLYDAQIENSLAQIDSIKQQADMWKELYDNAEEGSEEQTKYYENWQEAQSNLNDLVIKHINLLKNEYNNTLDNIIKDLEKSVTGGLGLDEMRENWEEAKAAADKYFDATERIYELESLQNKFQTAIADTSALDNQQKLKELMDAELADLEAKEKLTEYDIALAERRLAIAQAEIALEDARNSKNSMKLVRGADGNWNYQYVSDEDNIATKQQELLDAYQNLYSYIKETEQESVDAIVKMTEDFFAKLNEIRNDDSLNEEEKLAKMEELRNEYYHPDYGKISILQKEYSQYEKDLNQANAEFLWGLYQIDEANYEQMTDNQKAILNSFKEQNIADYSQLRAFVEESYDAIQDKLEVTTNENLVTWNTAAHEMAEAWNADDGESVRAQVEEAFANITIATDEYQIKVDELAIRVQEDFSETGIKGAIDAATEATDALKDATSDLVNQAEYELNEYKTYVESLEIAWYGVRDAVFAAIGKINDYSNSLNTAITKQQQLATLSNISLPAAQSTGNPSPSPSPNNPPNNPTTKPVTGGAGHGNMSNKNVMMKYDTGGYTGEWLGDDGKLAMLHSKELVLNASDTENILEVVKLTRDMASLTSSVGSAVMDGVKMMLYDLMGMKAPGNNMVMTPQVAEGDNIFNITAEFPNANDVTSIKEAILSLPNIASQYLSQNKK